MRVILIPRYGSPSVMVEQERPIPEPLTREILIKVEASGVNFADLLARMGLYPDAPKPPMVVGYEVCGLVEKVGSLVTDLKIGTRIFGFTRFNGYAEYALATRDAVVCLPANLTPVEGAAVPVNYVTAYINLIHVGSAKPKERVMIHGGSGGVGIATIQFAKNLDLELFATAGSLEKLEYLKSIGVQYPINYRTTDVVAEVKRLTNGKGVHLILDAVGGSSIRRDFRMLSGLGRIVCYGISSAAPGEKRNIITVLKQLTRFPKIKPIKLMNNNHGILGVNIGHLWDEQELLQTVLGKICAGLLTGQLKPVIAATFPLTARGAIQAHRFLHQRQNIGKVVLTRNT